MNLHDYLSVAPEIAEALAAGKPVVALESTILSHGMPYPENVEFAHKVEKIVREEGAIPATTAIIGGKLKVGLNDEELLTMCKAENVGKVSRRDVAVYLATGQTGATTVATTMIIASLAGIRFFATGGIGGVHRGAETTMDISADLEELAEAIGLDLPEEEDRDYDTLGGLVFAQLPVIPEDGSRPCVDALGLHIQVEELCDRRVEWALVEKLVPCAPDVKSNP